MKLVVFGDSWAYGSDIDERENNNYAKLLQKKLNAVSVDNRAKPGISNDAIIQQLLSWSAEENHKNTFVVIGWTSPERAEIFPDTTILKDKNSSHWITLGPWIFGEWFKKSENYPIKKEYVKDVEFYYTMLRTKFSCYIDWIKQLMLVQGFLQSKDISFHMHQAIYNNQHYELGHDRIPHQQGGINAKQMWDSISKGNFLNKDSTDDISLYGYLKNNEFDEEIFNPRGDHPNEYGHKLIADLLYNDIKQKGLI
tara:strand:- start:284 stop:1042 length:759 start_codon:yes stop_codon:yes gene_type:complete